MNSENTLAQKIHELEKHINSENSLAQKTHEHRKTH